jgi:GTPase SAR1 family protein
MGRNVIRCLPGNSPLISILGFNTQEITMKYKNLNLKIIKIAVWDTAGQERFRAASNLYDICRIFIF